MSQTKPISLDELLKRIEDLEAEVASLKGAGHRRDLMDMQFGPRDPPFMPAPVFFEPRILPEPRVLPEATPFIHILTGGDFPHAAAAPTAAAVPTINIVRTISADDTPRRLMEMIDDAAVRSG